MAEYVYSLDTNFPNGLNMSCLHDTIDEYGFPVTFDGIKGEGDVITIMFIGDLSGTDQTILNGMISAHNPENCPLDDSLIEEGVDMPVVQIRRTTDITDIPLSWIDIDCDTTDIENYPTMILHDDSNLDRIYVYEDGVYEISYYFGVDDECQTRVTKNDTDVLPGSEQDYGETGDTTDLVGMSGRTFFAELEANDFITLQVQARSTAENIFSGLILCVKRLRGPKGESGDDGQDGAPGSGSSLTIEDEGTPLANTPHSILNIVGNGVQITDQGSGRAQLDFSLGDAQYFDGYYEGFTTINTSWTDMPISAERQKTSAFTHTNPSPEVTVAVAGTYIVQYKVTVIASSGTSRSEAESRLVLDTGSGYAEVAGSKSEHYNRTQDYGATASSPLILDLDVGDKLKVQSIRSQGTSILQFGEDCCLVIFNSPGKGEKGDPGPAGSGVEIVVQDEGSNVTNTPHTVLDFRGDTVSVSDQGNGIARITIGGTVFGTGYSDAESLGESSTGSTSWQNKLQMIVNGMAAGRYIVNWSFEWTQSSNGEEFLSQVQIDNITTILNQSSRTPYYGAGSFGSFAYPVSGFGVVNLTSGNHTFDIDYRASGGTSYIRNVRLSVWRVS